MNLVLKETQWEFPYSENISENFQLYDIPTYANTTPVIR